MLNVAYIFPGQGAQYLGMGQDFYSQIPQAKEVFDRADSLLGFGLSEVIFKGPIEELTRTVNCQVAVFTASIAFLRALAAAQPAIVAKYTAGLSLGEYSALVAAEALSFEDALKLVRKRAEYMEEASQENPGGMVCLIGLSRDTVEEISAGTGTEVANLNCPGQVVISGSLAALEKAKELAKRAGAKKVIPLKVSGAFHSCLMEPAGRRLTQALEEVEIRQAKIPIVSNVKACVESLPQEIKANLARQIVSRTRWEDSINFIRTCGIKKFIEIGPGKVLKGLLCKIDPELTVYNIETTQDLDEFRKEHV